MTTPTEPALTNQWAIFDDGSVGAWRYEGDTPPALPAPGRTVSEAEYQNALAQIENAVEEHRAAQQADEQTAAKQAYDALIAAGLADAPARHLSHYDGP
ncbi:hypothetical protein [Streptomyces hokutonensis]|uniref:hypothetical protein n=1 Tax=Streptomyces hokutonensis TaxID=1306990 RepID=UPI0036C1000A